MAGLQKKQQPQAKTLTQHHTQMACWITPALAHWILGSLSLSIYLALSEPSVSSKTQSQSVAFSKFMVFTFQFVVMLPFYLLDSIVFSEPLSVFSLIMSTALQLKVVKDHKPLQFTKQINSPAS